jgi:hypothetical protein
MEIEFEHLRKLHAQLKQEKIEALDSRSLFPHVFREKTMPMYVGNSFMIFRRKSNHYSILVVHLIWMLYLTFPNDKLHCLYKMNIKQTWLTGDS